MLRHADSAGVGWAKTIALNSLNGVIAYATSDEVAVAASDAKRTLNSLNGVIAYATVIFIDEVTTAASDVSQFPEWSYSLCYRRRL